MQRMRLLIIAVLVVAGCKKDKAPASGSAPASTVVQDALWKLAPAGASTSIVVSPRGLSAIEAAAKEVKKVLEGAPELGSAHSQLMQYASVFGPAGASLAGAGMAADKGAAFFVVETGWLVLTPVVDRDKFLALTKGTKADAGDTVGPLTCRTVQKIYACARPATLLDQIGKAPVTDAMKLAGARGEIEIVLDHVDKPTGQPIDIALAVQLERGALLARGGLRGVPPAMLGKLVAANKHLDESKLAAFMVVNVAPMLAGVDVPNEPLVPGVMAADVISKINGPITMTAPPGSPAVDLSVPLADTTAAQKLVENCAEFPLAAMLGATVEQGACKLPVPQLAMTIEGRIEGNELRIGTRGTPASNVRMPASAIATELANGQWAVAIYGRGSLLGEGPLPPMGTDQMSDSQRFLFRVMTLFNEGGMGIRADGDIARVVIGLRTVWSNPDAVVAKVLAIQPSAVLDRSAIATAKQIAAGAAGSPFASDFQAGAGGVIFPLAVTAFVAGLIAPSFMSRDEIDSVTGEPLTHAEILAKLAELTDAMCACKDAACAQRVSDEMKEWSIAQARKGPPPKLSDADTAKAGALGDRMMKCMTTLLKAATPPNDAQRYVAMNAQYKDRICACKDDACAKAALDELTKWSEAFLANPNDSSEMREADQKRLAQIEGEIHACMKRLKK